MAKLQGTFFYVLRVLNHMVAIHGEDEIRYKMDLFLRALIFGGLVVLAFATGWWGGSRAERFEWQHSKRTLYICPSCKRPSIYLRFDGKYCCDYCSKAYLLHELGD